MSHLRFKNELDNAIEAKVWTTGDEDDGDFRLTYSMAGPTSLTENTMTEREARALHALLDLALYGEPLPPAFEQARV